MADFLKTKNLVPKKFVQVVRQIAKILAISGEIPTSPTAIFKKIMLSKSDAK
jgi:hypothetical protein